MPFWNSYGLFCGCPFNSKYLLTFVSFCRLTQKHDGQYLAEVTAACLERFGLATLVNLLGSLTIYEPDSLCVSKLHSMCMDNASNCDGTAKYLPVLIPTFRGMLSRGRCFPHIINLVAKVS